MKPEARIIAFDDSSFGFNDKKVEIVGTVFRSGTQMDGFVKTIIDKDGMDSTEKLIYSILTSCHYDQLSYIMIDGICLGGFNIVDIEALYKITKLPVIVVIRKRPDMSKFLEAMKNLDDFVKRIIILSHAGNIYTYRDIFYQRAGLTIRECEEILDKTCVNSNIPEPLRVAHIIASGKGRP